MTDTEVSAAAAPGQQAVDTTDPRFGNPIWAGETSNWPMVAGWNAILANIHTKAAIGRHGLTSAMGAPTVADQFYWASDTQKLWASSDGSAWTEVSPLHIRHGTFAAIGAATTPDQLYWASDQARLYASNDGAGGWTEVAPLHIRHGAVALLGSPTVADQLYWASDSQKLYASGAGGGSWIDVAAATATAAANTAANAVPKAQLIAATGPAGTTLGAGGGTLGLLGGQPMAAATWDRIVRVYLDAVIASSSGWAQFNILSDGAQIGQTVRGSTAQTTVHVEAVHSVPAGVSHSYSANIFSSTAMSIYGPPNGAFGIVAWPA